MLRKKLLKMIIIIMIIILPIMGCKNSKYENFTESYYKVYFKLVESFDSRKTLDAYEYLQKEQSKKEIQKLNELLKNIEGKVPTDRKKHYAMLVEWYNGLVYINNLSEKKWDELTKDERSYITNELILIGTRKSKKKDGYSW